MDFKLFLVITAFSSSMFTSQDVSSLSDYLKKDGAGDAKLPFVPSYVQESMFSCQESIGRCKIEEESSNYRNTILVLMREKYLEYIEGIEATIKRLEQELLKKNEKLLNLKKKKIEIK